MLVSHPDFSGRETTASLQGQGIARSCPWVICGCSEQACCSVLYTYLTNNLTSCALLPADRASTDFHSPKFSGLAVNLGLCLCL